MLLDPNSLPAMASSGSSKVGRPPVLASDKLLKTCSGVAYQLIEDDPLANTQQCELDASLLQQLGANAIRVYHVNETADHSGCMNAFASRGIYVFADLDNFHTYIHLVSQRSRTHCTG
jgi:hypothetical protein